MSGLFPGSAIGNPVVGTVRIFAAAKGPAGRWAGGVSETAKQ